MSEVILNHIQKTYPNGYQAVKDFNMEIKDQEFIIFVGPSGCGKSTTLRMIAGLEDISGGTLKIDNVVCNDREPKDRNIAMVFQNYALYPHMTVRKNMEYPLKIAKLPKEEIDARIEHADKILGLQDLLERKPKALSGGQRQRVAMGRAIVRNPKVLLMDEPLSNLDAKLRGQMRIEIARLHKELKATTIYVTHDQTEAMTLGDRIVVMSNGEIQQIDTPQNLYERPRNLFVATFIGMPVMNILEAEYDGSAIVGQDFRIEASDPLKKILDQQGFKNGRTLKIGIRPENLRVGTKEDKNTLAGRVDVAEMLGSTTNIYITTKNGSKVVAALPGDVRAQTDQELFLVPDLNMLHIFDAETGLNILEM